MPNLRIATRYAEALLTTAEELHILKNVSDDLTVIQHIMQESREFQLFLKSPVIKKEKKQEVCKSDFWTFRSTADTSIFYRCSLKRNGKMPSRASLKHFFDCRMKCWVSSMSVLHQLRNYHNNKERSFNKDLKCIRKESIY